MRRRNVLKNKEAVSPVIATILMVAITVVLAATLYMMLPDAEDTRNPVSGTISVEFEDEYEETEGDVAILSFDVLGTPSRIDLDDLEVYLVVDGDDRELDMDEDLVGHSFLADDDTSVRAGSELVFGIPGEFGEENLDRVVVFVDGYDGSFSANF